MKTKILIGSIIAVALLTLVSFSSVVGYNVVKDTQEEIITDEYEEYTPIALVLQLIFKLRNHKDIENVESEEDVLEIIESDAELSGIIEKLKSFGCGCEDANTNETVFLVICSILFFPSMIVALYRSAGMPLPFLTYILTGLNDLFNCGWLYEKSKDFPRY